MKHPDYFRELIDALLKGEASTRDDIQRLKLRLCRKYRMDRLPGNSEILAHVSKEDMDILEPLLRTKPVRTVSGVAVVAVMTSPHDCPHGKCLYCPGGVRSGTAQSYTGREPAALRAAAWKFDPHDQVKARLGQLEAIGHPTDKVDLIIMGGTFTARDENYQRGFVKECFDAMNGTASGDMAAAHLANETARHRCIGLTVETRPDYFMEKEADLALELGATRVELGVQTLNDATLERVNRGHGSRETAAASRVARDAGLKLCYHMMPSLPGESPESDLATFERLFSDPDFRPDMLKIYPTLVIDGTGLYDMWRAGEYEPYDIDTLVKLLADIKEELPGWVRVQRIQRDIPVQLIEAGGRKSHIRELVRRELDVRGKKCRCIRCREAGHNALRGRQAGELSLTETRYEAGGGTEFFLAYEDSDADIIAGFARLRLSSGSAHRPEMENSAVIRELRIVSQQLPISSRSPDSLQHRGLGTKLVERCLETAGQQGAGRLLVTSGVGAREYYRKMGFRRVGPYMGRDIG